MVWTIRGICVMPMESMPLLSDMFELTSVLFVIGGYLVGSLSSAIIVCRVLKLPDPRSIGSGNPGATNVLRLGGKKAAAATLVGDILKGLLPVLLAVQLELQYEVVALVAVAAFLGHLYPLFFGFRGGKGVATFLGVSLGMSWLLGGLVILSWLIVAFISRISSLSALVAVLLAPIYCWYLLNSVAITAALVLMMLILYWRHSDNIGKIISGTESKIGS